MTNPNDLEDAVRDRFERAMSDATAPVHILQSGAIAQGRRIRRRSRAVLAVGSVAAVAVTAIGIQYAAGGTEAKDANDFTQPGTPTATPPDPTPSPSSGLPSLGPEEVPAGEPDSGPEGWWSMPASTMATELRNLLPQGTRLTDPVTKNLDRAPGEELRELEGYLIATLRPEAGGPGKVNVKLYAPETGRLSCSPDSVSDPADCRQLKAEDGTVIGRVLDSTKGEVRSLTLDLATADGGVVMVSVANSLDEKWPEGATPSADKVPLTLAQLRSIARNPAWTSYQP